jgi:uracil-DNA glycosylase
LVLESGHPSPMSANQGKWFGNKHFSQANEYLKNHNLQIINWL